MYKTNTQIQSKTFIQCVIARNLVAKCDVGIMCRRIQ